MTYTVLVMSKNDAGIAWRKMFTSHSQRGARQRATNWIKKHFDRRNVDKEYRQTSKERWWIK